MSTTGEPFKIQTELSEVLRLHNQTLERLRAFQHERPYVVAPNIMKMVEENLKENVTILYKQWNEVHKPPTERVRHVCTQCSFVFASALPGGICDECRSKPGGQPSTYGAWPVTPESEAVTLSDATPLPTDMAEERDVETSASETGETGSQEAGENSGSAESHTDNEALVEQNETAP